jgi:DNA-binding HxlR family transcriptional regulator
VKRIARLYGCPVELTLDLLGGKWKTVILARLKNCPLRYSELRRAVPGLTDKMLTQRLRDLEGAGFIERTGRSDGRGRYRLTILGQSLGPALEGLYAWGSHVAPTIGARFASQPPSGAPTKSIAVGRVRSSGRIR